ncbi:hypothetical protein REPUB_Repub13aG0038600 [Reevesia pubescens]
MNDLPPYPPNDPTTFNLIVIGTGLPESIIATAASFTSKSIFHLDSNPFYGSHFSSLSLTDFPSFLTSYSSSSSPSPSHSSNDYHNFTVLDLATRPLYSSIDISNYSPHLLHQHSRKFNLNVAGPRVFFCADKSIDLMLKSGVNQYLEFKSIDATFLEDDKGNRWSVPDSRAAIFKDKSLGLMEKNQLMRFFKLVQGHLAGEQGVTISEEDLQSPFPNALGALLYPVYVQGELSQAYCRHAAVIGCLYDGGCYKGVRLASGQDIFSKKLILDPSFTVPLPAGSSPPHPLFSLRDDRGKVSRGICITKTSLKPDILNFLVVYPPRSLLPDQVTSIRLLQIGSNLAVCPPGMFVLYISTLCNDDDQGKKLLHAVMNTLLTVPVSINSERNAASQSETAESGRIAQDGTAENLVTMNHHFMGQVEFICSTPMPDGKLNYNNLLDVTVKLFQEIYPDEEFFPETSSSDNSEDDGGIALET